MLRGSGCSLPGIGLVTAILGLVTQLGGFGGFRLPVVPDLNPGVNQDVNPAGCNPAVVSPTLSLSQGSGPSGTELTITGRDFCPDQRVEIRFHTEQIAVAQTDANGEFAVDARIPGTFDFAAPGQFDIVASGPAGGARTPFQLTQG